MCDNWQKNNRLDFIAEELLRPLFAEPAPPTSGAVLVELRVFLPVFRLRPMQHLVLLLLGEFGSKPIGRRRLRLGRASRRLGRAGSLLRGSRPLLGRLRRASGLLRDRLRRATSLLRDTLVGARLFGSRSRCRRLRQKLLQRTLAHGSDKATIAE